MRAPLSVIVPTLNAEAALPLLLADLMAANEAGLLRELILSDGGSTDQSQRIAEAVGAEWVTGPAGRGGQLQRGVAQAKGDWLLILHADSHLPEGWLEAVSRHIGMAHGPDHGPDQSADQKAGYFALSFDAKGPMPRLVAGWANLRARLLGLPYGDQGLLLSRVLYDQIGGYPDIPLMEDVAIAKALTGQLRPLDARIVTSAAKYQQQGWLRRGTRNLVTLLRYLAGADPEDLAQAYRR